MFINRSSIGEANPNEEPELVFAPVFLVSARFAGFGDYYGMQLFDSQGRQFVQIVYLEMIFCDGPGYRLSPV